ncbi:type II toxin-antitoxin system RelE/ParE family toxin [Sphingomonas sp. BK580]|uniref:type II toxin-antitoxin system RelE/ParE family toxin n=1 Tax=Sphingomonas sp. BK580 TaxID=2586972 RepID=UPI001814546D|nr:type II toxin-antitoxin system RelE/ParE family toxin [Sphingomonas sp. BK580]MBB3691545.1 plasmid stabilization system protein ParE [Sphingomonas sp. BK580]
MALTEVERIVAYVEMFDRRAAERLKHRLYRLADSLTDFPQRGRLMRDGSRELATVPPYLLRYDVVGDMVYVLSVRHGARRTATRLTRSFRRLIGRSAAARLCSSR